MAREPQRLRLSLDVERGSEPIAGRLSDEHGGRWGFLGWVQLTAAIEEAVAVQPPQSGGERAS